MKPKLRHCDGIDRFCKERELGLSPVIGWERWASLDGLVGRLAQQRTIKVHTGCVNTIVWSDCGRYLLSGSDDRTLCVSDTWLPPTADPVVARVQQSGHRGNVFSARFLPGTDGRMVVSCAGDGSIAVNDVYNEATHGTRLYNCHQGTVYEDVIVECRHATCAVNVHPRRPFELAVGCVDSVVRLYDLRKVVKPAGDTTGLVGLQSMCVLPADRIAQAGRHRRVTSVDYSTDGRLLVVSFSSDNVYVYSATSFAPNDDKVDMSKLEEFGKKPPKRIRLRGDWSDTGPQARPGGADGTGPDGTGPGGAGPDGAGPAGSQSQQPSAAQAAGSPDTDDHSAVGSNQHDAQPVGVELLQRFSDVLSRMFESAAQRQEQESQRESGAAAADEEPSAAAAPDVSAAGDEPDVPSTSTAVKDSADSGYDSKSSPQQQQQQPFSSVEEAATAGALQQKAGLRERLRQFKRKHLKGNKQGESTTSDASGAPTQLTFREKTARLWRAVVQSVPQNQCLAAYAGHRNARTTLKQAALWGTSHVLSGSDCGHVFVWHRHTHRLLLAFNADKHVVNCVQPNPAFAVLATSGIEYDIKLWAPIADQPFDNADYLQMVILVVILVERNQKMLEETRDTVTIPAMYMLRMLAQMDRRPVSGLESALIAQLQCSRPISAEFFKLWRRDRESSGAESGATTGEPAADEADVSE